MHGSSKPKSFIDHIEETFIAVTLGLMTLITFANVIARYIFNSNILWGLEATVFLFAWLVLIGASYGVKKSFHIGIDVVLVLVPAPVRKFLTLLACACCVTFAALMLKGAWDYWSPFIGKRAFYETNDLPVPFFLTWMSDVFNEGEAYEKLPRFIPYAALPIGMSLLLFRFLQATWYIVTGHQTSLIASHEAEELMEEVTQNKPANGGNA
ncbi:MAG: TRAP transporter small permease [Pseudomonadota bacterium]